MRGSLDDARAGDDGNIHHQIVVDIQGLTWYYGTMARKHKLPPALLKIELLSSGIDPFAVDDLTQEPLPQPNARPPKIDNAQAHRDAHNRAKALAGQRILERASTPKPIDQRPFKRRI